MNAQKLAQVNPDLHEKYKKIMDLDIKAKDDQALSMNDAPQQQDMPEKPEEKDEKLLPEHAEDGHPASENTESPKPPLESEKNEAQTNEPSVEPGEPPKTDESPPDTKPDEKGSHEKSVEEKTTDEKSNTKPAESNAAPPTPLNETPPPSDTPPQEQKKESSETKSDASYEKILEKNLDDMASSPQASGVTPDTQPQPAPTPTPTDTTVPMTPPVVAVESTVGKPLKKKTSILTEIMFIILGLAVLAVYTIIWMKLLNYKI